MQVKILFGCPNSGTHTGDIFVAKPYYLDPCKMVTLVSRVTDGYTPHECIELVERIKIISKELELNRETFSFFDGDEEEILGLFNKYLNLVFPLAAKLKKEELGHYCDNIKLLLKGARVEILATNKALENIRHFVNSFDIDYKSKSYRFEYCSIKASGKFTNEIEDLKKLKNPIENKRIILYKAKCGKIKKSKIAKILIGDYFILSNKDTIHYETITGLQTDFFEIPHIQVGKEKDNE